MATVRVMTSEAMPDAVQSTPGMYRREAWHDEGAWVGTVHTERGVLTGWHVHPDYDTYVHVLDGRAVVEYGPGGMLALTAGPGDFLAIGRGVVHREGTAQGSNGVEGVLVRVGHGPLVENRDGPDPA